MSNFDYAVLKLLKSNNFTPVVPERNISKKNSA